MADNYNAMLGCAAVNGGTDIITNAAEFFMQCINGNTGGYVFGSVCRYDVADGAKIDPEHPRRGLKDKEITWWSDWLWFDLDFKENPTVALEDAITLLERLDARDDAKDGVLLFFSGGKGFHLLVSVDRFEGCRPSPTFHLEAKELARQLAGDLRSFDLAVYDVSRVLRLPNAPHHDANGNVDGFKVQITIDPQRLYEWAVDEFDFKQLQPGPGWVSRWAEHHRDIDRDPAWGWPHLEADFRPCKRVNRLDDQQARQWPDGQPRRELDVVGDYNANYDPRLLLEAEGWEYFGKGDGLKERYTRPGGDGVGADVVPLTDWCYTYIFTDNAPHLEPETGYTNFELYARLRHWDVLEGRPNYVEAKEALRNEGWGRPWYAAENPVNKEVKEEMKQQTAIDNVWADLFNEMDARNNNEVELVVRNQLEEEKPNKYPDGFDPAWMNQGGMLGLILDQIDRASFIKQPVIALGAALEFMSFLIGPKYRLFQTYANLYSLSVAPSGSGKNMSIDILKRIRDAAIWRDDTPDADIKDLNGIYARCGQPGREWMPEDFRRWGRSMAQLASEQAGMEMLLRVPYLPLLLVWDEMGRDCATARKTKNGTRETVLNFLTAVYSAAGSSVTEVARAGLFRNKRDGEAGELRTAKHPFLSLIAATQPELLYGAMSSNDVRGGLLGRFCVWDGVDLTDAEIDSVDLCTDEASIAINEELVRRVQRWMAVHCTETPAEPIPARVDDLEGVKRVINGFHHSIMRLDDDDEAKSVKKRLGEMALKFTLIFACSRLDDPTEVPTVTVADAELAVAIAAYQGDRLAYIAENCVTNSPVVALADQVLDWLKRQKLERVPGSLYSHRFQRAGKTMRKQALEELADRGQIRYEERDGRGNRYDIIVLE